MSSVTHTLKIAAFCFFGFAVQHAANAATITNTGTFTADNQVFEQTLVVSATQLFSFFTTSYGGGRNLDGSTTLAGGFVPVLTLFSSVTGKVVGTDGASGVCSGSARLDPTTRMCDDTFFTATLTPATYILDLTEFPNVANDRLTTTPRFLFSSDVSATGTTCGVPGGKFLQADLAPCVQRNGSFAVNVSSVPEPATWLTLLPAAGALFCFRRRS